MAVRLTRKGLVLIALVLFTLVGSAVGYVAWRINQIEKLAEQEVDAGSGGGGSCPEGVTCSCNVCVRLDGSKFANGSCENISNAPIGSKTVSNCGMHGSCFRVNCQDYGGGWIQSIHQNTATACGSCGWSKTPVENPGTQTDCKCEKYIDGSNRCGVNCTFPSGTQGQVDKKAKDTGKPHIAMCRPGGILVIEEFGAGHVCQGLTHVCKNPVGNPPTTSEPNVCEGGGIITKAPSTPLKVGESIDITGYAFDADGINKGNVAVSVNGQSAGNASSTDACPSGNTTICSQVGTSKKPVVWTYKHTATKEGEDVIQVSWKDTKGNSRAACSTSLKLTVQNEQVQTNPDWELNKSGVGMCVDDNTQNPSTRVNYTISLTNVGDVVGSIDKIVDTLDQKVLADYIMDETIVPSASVNTNVITWDLSGSDASFSVGETKTFKYSITIPHQAFGTYTNTVVVTPVEGDELNDSAVVQADCTVVTPPGEETPETSIFDETIAKILVGLVLILSGIGYIYIDNKGVNTLLAIRGVNNRISKSARVKKSRERFEKRVVK